MPLSDIVDVQISAQTQAIPQQSFGLPMILGTSKSFVDIIRQYSNMSGVAEDFTPTQPEYIAAASIFGQRRSPTSIFIGRRNADTVSMNVVSGQPNATYNVTINGATATVNSATLSQTITVGLSGPLVANNLINVVLNNVYLGTTRSRILYSSDFGGDNVITTAVNGVILSPSVSFTVDQATTLAAVAAQIEALPSVTSATPGPASPNPQYIDVVFANPGLNTITSSTVTGTAAPTSTISEGGFIYAVSSADTLTAIASAIQLQPNIATAVAGVNSITITGDPGAANVLNTFTVSVGAVPTITVTNSSLRNTIAQAMVTAIGTLGEPVNALYSGTPEGAFSVSAQVAGVPYTLTTSSSIETPNNVYIEVTNVVPVQDYTVTLNGTEYTYTTTDAIQTNEQIVAELVALINANSNNSLLSATDNLNGSFYVAAPNAATVFSVFASAELFAIVKGVRVLPLVATDVVGTTLTAIRNANNNWYGLILTDRTKATVQAVMTWAEANKPVLFATASDDPVIINTTVGADSTSVAKFAQTNGYIRSFVMYHQDAATDYPEAAWMGLTFTYDPGSETWKFKTLNGVANSALTTTQSNNALNKNANTYEFIGGVSITQNGTTGQGEFIDIIRGMDWLTNNIQTNVYSVLVNNPKVPYTDAGISVIQNQVLKSLQQGVAQDFLSDDPAPVVTVPKASAVPAIDKANRILKNVNFTATLAGAIHVVQIRGTLTL